MIVYLDVLLLVDLIIDYFLLLSVKRITMSPGGKLRLFCGALPAALSSLILLCPSLPFLVNVLYMVGTAAIVTAIAFPQNGWRSFFRRLFWYAAMNLGFGGSIYFLSQFCGVKGIVQHNLAVYIQVSPLVLLAGIVVTYLVLKVILFFGEPRGAVTKRLEIKIGEQNFFTEALLDTGFRLSDCMTGQPVLLLRVWSKLPLSLRVYVEKYRQGLPVGPAFRLIP
ncbi:MAG: sigma-E processing peptidase SpoIIGA, partial [Oscillospiraceae bacterium]|nr:sigma-E processing peptidase SpoIIGA [Oscillospiraceae bacterium]